jgi:hypothetical protein
MKRNFKSVIVNNITKENRKQNVSYLLRQAIAYIKDHYISGIPGYGFGQARTCVEISNHVRFKFSNLEFIPHF